MNEEQRGTKLPSVGDYFSATQLRADRWSALRETTESMLVHGVEGRQGSKLFKTAQALFDALAPIELYWAFPGIRNFEHLQRLLEQRNVEDLAISVRRVARALTSGAYRRRAIPIGGDDADNEDFEDESALAPEDRALGRPYFEVLIVDNVNEQQERFLRNNLHRMRRSEDPFIYEAVVVPSIEDALMGILFNHNVQAVIVRPGLVLKSKNVLPIVDQYLHRLNQHLLCNNSFLLLS